MTRQYMVDYRTKHGLGIERMAKRCKCGIYLLTMIEEHDRTVTHPNIAKRIAKAYKLTKRQFEGLIPENYRTSSPNYDPDRHKCSADFTDFNVAPIRDTWHGKERE